MPHATDFHQELASIFRLAQDKRLTAIILKAGDLHRLVGGYPGADNRMPICCNVMRQHMRHGDELVYEPPKGAGANLTIKYQFPRKA